MQRTIKTLSESQRSMITLALGIARERFNEHIITLSGGDCGLSQDARDRLSRQFEKQIEEADEVSALLEEAEEIRL